MKLRDCFLEYQQYMIVEKGYSNNTIKNYTHVINKFIIYMNNTYNINDIADIKLKHVEDYIKSLSELKPITINISVKTLRQFFKFLTKEEIIKINILSSLETLKQEKKLPVVLSQDEIKTFINELQEDTIEHYRDKCMIILLYSSGLRISELCYLKLKDININKRIIKCTGKGNKERIIPIDPTCALYLKTYIEDYRPIYLKKNTPYIFINKKGESITREAFYNHFKKYATQSSVKKNFSPHSIRHTFATHLLQNDADLRSIQELLGHSDISTTTIYTQVSNDKAINEYMTFHPRADKRH